MQVGKLTPPHPSQVPNLMYQFADDVNFRLSIVETKDEIAELLAYLHHRFVWIHPFNNGNGRTARLLLNAAAMLKGIEPIQLYHREGEARKEYIEALRKADEGDNRKLTNLIFNELTAFEFCFTQERNDDGLYLWLGNFLIFQCHAAAHHVGNHGCNVGLLAKFGIFFK